MDIVETMPKNMEKDITHNLFMQLEKEKAKRFLESCPISVPDQTFFLLDVVRICVISYVFFCTEYKHTKTYLSSMLTISTIQELELL